MNTLQQQTDGIPSGVYSEALSKANTRGSVLSDQRLAEIKKQEQEAEEEIMRPKKCCGCMLSYVLQYVVIACVIFDLIIAAIMIYIILLLSFNTHATHFQKEYVEQHTKGQMNKVENRYILLMLPIVCFLFYKTYKGIMWIVRGFSRPAMQTYYVTSWAFYTAYVVQTSFIVTWTWNVFNDDYRFLSLFSIFICFPLLLLLTIYMKFLDRKAYAINSFRVQAKRAAQQTILDKELVERHFSHLRAESLRQQMVQVQSQPLNSSTRSYGSTNQENQLANSQRLQADINDTPRQESPLEQNALGIRRAVSSDQQQTRESRLTKDLQGYEEVFKNEDQETDLTQELLYEDEEQQP